MHVYIAMFVSCGLDWWQTLSAGSHCSFSSLLFYFILLIVICSIVTVPQYLAYRWKSNCVIVSLNNRATPIPSSIVSNSNQCVMCNPGHRAFFICTGICLSFNSLLCYSKEKCFIVPSVKLFDTWHQTAFTLMYLPLCILINKRI